MSALQTLERLEGLAKAATSGEWFPVHCVVLVDAPGRGETDFPSVASCVGDENADANAAYISALSPGAMLKLIAVARAALAASDYHAKLAGICRTELSRDDAALREALQSLTGEKHE